MTGRIGKKSVGAQATEGHEARLLRHLCTQGQEKSERAKLITVLGDHRFTTVHHQVLFDCLRSLPAARPELIESLLPVRLVRAGFPDFDLDPFLRPSGLSAAQAVSLARALTAKS
jgi:hypothetical protein